MFTIEELIEHAIAEFRSGPPSRRFLIGVTGPPAAGKTITAEAIRDGVNARLGPRVAEVAPMDGFHLPNAELDRLGLRDRKGAPETFDPAGYVAALIRLRAVPIAEARWPQYDRSVHEPVPDALVIGVETRLVITEGNYLLHRTPPWDQVVRLLDSIWYLSLDKSLRRERLMRRHRAVGRTEAEALHKATGVDEENAQIVESTKERANLVVRALADGSYALDEGARSG